MLVQQLFAYDTFLHANAEFTLLDFSPDFHSASVLRNLRQMPEIRGKSVLVHASDNHTVWIIKDAIWENRMAC